MPLIAPFVSFFSAIERFLICEPEISPLAYAAAPPPSATNSAIKAMTNAGLGALNRSLMARRLRSVRGEVGSGRYPPHVRTLSPFAVRRTMRPGRQQFNQARLGWASVPE